MAETLLDGAIKNQTPSDFKRTVLHDTLGRGGHVGYFVGLGETHKAEVRCKKCNGTGAFRGKNGDEPHRACSGTGRTAEEKVAILYQMGKDLMQEEWVTYSLSPAGTLRDGSAKSATTLYRRMRAFSGGIDDPDKLKAWYSKWVADGKKRIPIDMYVADNQNQTALAIRDVTLHEKKPRPIVDDDFLAGLE